MSFVDGDLLFSATNVQNQIKELGSAFLGALA